jgi:hypothetical protein
MSALAVLELPLAEEVQGSEGEGWGWSLKDENFDYGL